MIGWWNTVRVGALVKRNACGRLQQHHVCSTCDRQLKCRPKTARHFAVMRNFSEELEKYVIVVMLLIVMIIIIVIPKN